MKQVTGDKESVPHSHLIRSLVVFKLSHYHYMLLPNICNMKSFLCTLYFFYLCVYLLWQRYKVEFAEIEVKNSRCLNQKHSLDCRNTCYRLDKWTIFRSCQPVWLFLVHASTHRVILNLPIHCSEPHFWEYTLL